MSGTGNSLLDGNNIGDAIVGGGLAGAANGASMGTMLDDRFGTGTFKFGIGGRKQQAAIKVVDFGYEVYMGKNGMQSIEYLTEDRTLSINISENGKKVGSVALTIYFNRTKNGRLIGLASRPPRVMPEMGGLQIGLTSVSVEQSFDYLYSKPENITLDILIQFTGNSIAIGHENGFSLQVSGGNSDAQAGIAYNYNYTSSKTYNGKSHYVGGICSFKKSTGDWIANHTTQGWDKYIELTKGVSYMFVADPTYFYRNSQQQLMRVNGFK
jgi:hypothetical protein